MKTKKDVQPGTLALMVLKTLARIIHEKWSDVQFLV
jgi:hypothetical protein